MITTIASLVTLSMMQQGALVHPDTPSAKPPNGPDGSDRTLGPVKPPIVCRLEQGIQERAAP